MVCVVWCMLSCACCMWCAVGGVLGVVWCVVYAECCVLYVVLCMVCGA